MAKTRIYSAAVSRRDLMHAAALAAAGLTTATVFTFAEKPRRSQEDVNYQDHPRNGERCDTCAPFIPPDGCKTVLGTVTASGWCKIYVDK